MLYNQSNQSNRQINKIAKPLNSWLRFLVIFHRSRSEHKIYFVQTCTINIRRIQCKQFQDKIGHFRTFTKFPHYIFNLFAHSASLIVYSLNNYSFCYVSIRKCKIICLHYRDNKSRLFVIWLAGVDFTSSICTTIQVTEKQTNLRSVIYTGPIMNLR